MANLSKKIIMAAIMVTLAVGPHYLTGAYTVSTDGGSKQTPYSNTSGGVGANDSGTGSGGGLSTNDPSYQGLPGAEGNQNTSEGVGSDGNGSSSGSTTGSGAHENTSEGVGSSGSSQVAYNTNTGDGVSTSDDDYKGLPGLEGKPNSSGGVGSSGSGSSGSDSSSTGNTSDGVSTTDDDYKGLPGADNDSGTGNTSDGVSTSDDDYKGLPDNDDDDDDDVSECDGRLYPKDINGHWSEIYVRRLYDLCIIEGYRDGTFRPNQAVTRAELVKMSLYSKGIDPNPGCYDADCGSPFTDLDMWQGKWIRPAWDRDIVKGYSKTRFAPNKPITRAEAVKVVLATYGYDPVNTSDSFFNDVNGWSVGWVEKAHQIGLVQGVGNGNFDPNRSITRAEAAKIIAKMMEYWDTPVR